MAPALRSSSKRRPGQRTGKPVGRGQPAAVKRQVHKPVVRKPVKKNKKKNADAEEESNEEDGEEGSGEEDDEKGSGEDGSPKESDKEWKPKRKMKKNKGKGKAVDVKSNNGSDKNQGSETEDINKLPPRLRWDAFDEAQRKEITDSCTRAIQEYLLSTSPEREVPNNLRSYLREVAELCPQVGYADQELALHCLTTRFQNTFCLYHHYHDKAGKTNDANPPDSHSVTGVPWRRDAKNRDPTTEAVIRTSKVLHCGCFVDDALWDFFWWKTGYINSPYSGLTESWRSTRLAPRARGLMVQFVQDLTNLTIDDVFSGTMDGNESRLQVLRRMEGYIRDACTKLEREIEEKEIE